MNAPATVPAIAQTTRPASLVEKFAARYTVEPGKLLSTLKATAFKVDGGEATNEQMMALLIVADQYKLNPFTKEIYAFPDKHKGIVPVVSVDGWARIVNEHDAFDGVEFEYGPALGDKGRHEWIECIMFRKDRSKSIRAREFWAEVSRDTGPWKSHPNRMHRHKAYIQCARLAFGFAGIYDEDEAERIIEKDVTPQAIVEPTEAAPPATRTASVTAKVRSKAAANAAPPIDAEPVVESKPAVEAPAGEAPPAWTFEKAMKYIDDSKNADQADLILDQSRGQLPDDEYKRLVEARNKKWSELVDP